MWFVKRPLRSVKGPIRKMHELFMKTGYSTVSEHMEWQWVFWQCDDSHYHKQKWIEARFFFIILNSFEPECKLVFLRKYKALVFLKSSNHSPVSYSWLLVLIFLQGNLIFKHLFIILEHVSIKVLVFRVNQCSIDMHSMFVKLICFAMQRCNHFSWNAWQWKGQRNEVA